MKKMPYYSSTKKAIPVVEEPPYLTVGTDVSAKYKGAFCEAKIAQVDRHVKLRVLFKGSNSPHSIDDADLKAGYLIKNGTLVEARHPDKGQAYIQATITKITDYSRYTVIFDDGDQCVLRRNSLCLKSGKHFAESETLDQLPLTNPEHFGNPVKVGSGAASLGPRVAQSYYASNSTNSNNSTSNNISSENPNQTTTTNTTTTIQTPATSNTTYSPDTTNSPYNNNNNNNNNNGSSSSSSNPTAPVQQQAGHTSNDVSKISSFTVADEVREDDSESSTTNNSDDADENNDFSNNTSSKSSMVAQDNTSNTVSLNESHAIPSPTNNQTAISDVNKWRDLKGRRRRESTKEMTKPKFVDNADDDVSSNVSDQTGELEAKTNIRYDTIEIGVRLRVKYGKGKLLKVYEAKVNKMDVATPGKPRYYVHYTGWNNRYDEWITRSRIVSIVRDDSSRRRKGNVGNKGIPLDALANDQQTLEETIDVKPKQEIDVTPLQEIDVTPIQEPDVSPVQETDVKPIQIDDSTAKNSISVESPSQFSGKRGRRKGRQSTLTPGYTRGSSRIKSKIKESEASQKEETPPQEIEVIPMDTTDVPTSEEIETTPKQEAEVTPLKEIDVTPIQEPDVSPVQEPEVKSMQETDDSTAKNSISVESPSQFSGKRGRRKGRPSTHTPEYTRGSSRIKSKIKECEESKEETSPQEIDVTPMDTTDVPPSEEIDTRPKQEVDVIPLKENDDDTPMQEPKASPLQETDDILMKEPEVSPLQETDDTPMQEAEVSPTQKPDVSPVQEADNRPIEEPHVTPVHVPDETNMDVSEIEENSVPAHVPISEPPNTYKFCEPIDEVDCDKKISILLERLHALRQTYISIKAEVAQIDRRRKKARNRRDRKELRTRSATAAAEEILNNNWL